MTTTQKVPGEDMSCALALVNTRHMRAGHEVDQVSDPASAAGWLAARGLIPPGFPAQPGDAVRLVRLREAIRELFTASASGMRPPERDIATLNDTLAGAWIISSLTWDDTGPHRGERLPSETADPVSTALARIAADGLSVLTAPDGPRPAACQAHGCIRWFLRTHAARQWCSTRCGDRVRAARHYARQQARLRIRARCPGKPFRAFGLVTSQARASGNVTST
ncbi:MAG: CGNR zinc finger domain-containing protein, partial [Trebonia sp.]